MSVKVRQVNSSAGSWSGRVNKLLQKQVHFRIEIEQFRQLGEKAYGHSQDKRLHFQTNYQIRSFGTTPCIMGQTTWMCPLVSRRLLWFKAVGCNELQHANFTEKYPNRNQH